jgi:competence protein ComEC
MAALVLGARSVGIAISAWPAFAIAVAAVLVVAPELVVSVGFQLSVAATFGVLVVQGRRSNWLASTAAATIGAQLAVAPLLLFHFGSVPLLSPIANVMAAPLVAAGTVVGGLAALSGLAVLVPIAGWLGDLVTTVASAFAAGPQLGPVGVVVALAVAGSLAIDSTRVVGAVAAAVLVAWSILPLGDVASPEVVVLDVGQGDAVLLRGGARILIDGGPDGAVLRDALYRYHADRLDLLIVTHSHADHITGAVAALSAVEVGMLWYPAFLSDPAIDRLLEVAAAKQVPSRAVQAGDHARVGPFALEVLGPRRRYASPNDGSVVVAVSAGGPRLLAAGDIEVIAQAELSPGPVDILKVPHQGAATSSIEWLIRHSGDVAVVSVGPNSFGHPSDEVVAALRGAGATVLRTDVDGDIRLSMAPLPLPP